MRKSLEKTYDIEERNRVAVKAFLKLSELWKLTQLQQIILLGNSVDRTSLARWKKQIEEGKFSGRLDKDQVDRIAILLSIHKCLKIIYPYKEIAYGWVNRSNDDFFGAAPIDFMTKEGSITELIEVQNYLDNVRGGNI